MDKGTCPATTPDEKIVHFAKEWRRHDRQAIAAKPDRDTERAEYRARQQLRQVIDLAGEAGQP